MLKLYHLPRNALEKKEDGTEGSLEKRMEQRGVCYNYLINH